MEDEEPALRELVAAAEAVGAETKITRILGLLEERFSDRAILFFTEYKATQSLLMSALMERYGESSVTFINGDERADEVRRPDGELRTLFEDRAEAARKFNAGEVRFLVSTEAAGEGIDLQERAYTLIHVDLPWNPMRLHQRVGRLNRYGQQHRVEVVSLRNPDTVESLIWERLDEKLARITLAHGQVMESPEDMHQLVLGMTSPSLFNELFAGASSVPRESLSQWFDQQTAQFGGQDVVRTLRDLVGNVRRFDFQQVSEQLPQVDLPDLRPFMEAALILNNRRPREEDGGLSFLTPDAWRDDRAVQSEYRGLLFDRRDRSADAQRRLVGVGHRALDQALRQASNRAATVTQLPTEVLERPLLVFRVRDRITGRDGGAPSIIVGLRPGPEKDDFVLMLDWQVLQLLNNLPLRRTLMNEPPAAPKQVEGAAVAAREADLVLRSRLSEVDHRFRFPEAELLAVLWCDGF
jgi:hypothetical protein